MGTVKEEFYKKYNSMKKLKSKRIYSFGVYFINVIPLIFISTVFFEEKLADKLLGQYDIKIDFILSMVGILFTYISILFAALKYNFDKHNQIINGQKITKLIFKKNAFYSGGVLCLLYVITSICLIISGLINQTLNFAAFNILQIGLFITIYSLSYLVFINLSSESLYYIYVFRPLINNIRMSVRLNGINVFNFIEALDEIIVNICYGKEKSIYIEIFNMAIDDLSKIRDWTIYKLICKRVEKINEILDEKSLEILQINKILIDYFNKLIAFEETNISRGNASYLKKIKKRVDQRTYLQIKEQIEGYGKGYKKSLYNHQPEWAKEIVKKFQFMEN